MTNSNVAAAPREPQGSTESIRFAELSSKDTEGVTGLLNFFSLREHPFGATPNPRFLFESCTHRDAFENLVAGIESGDGFQTLIANPGMGKTTLVARLLGRYEGKASTAFLFQTQCDSREFLQYLSLDLKIDSSMADGIVTMHQRFRQFLASERGRGRRVIVVVDEAQNLENVVLETIRLLSNYETFNSKLLHIVLAGQMQLMHRLLAPELLQLRQRISKLNRLDTLSSNEVAGYIDHRLKVAGYTGGELFTLNAVGLIAGHAGGVPRNINTICSASLARAHGAQQKTIGASIVKKAIEQLGMANCSVESDLRALLPPIATKNRSTGPSQLTLQTIVNQLQQATGATGVAIALGSKETMVCLARSGKSGPGIGSLINMQSGISGEAARTAEIVVCNDVEKDLRTDPVHCKALEIRSLVLMPLLDERRITGIIGIFSDRQDAFQVPELEVLKRAVGTYAGLLRKVILQM